MMQRRADFLHEARDMGDWIDGLSDGCFGNFSGLSVRSKADVHLCEAAGAREIWREPPNVFLGDRCWPAWTGRRDTGLILGIIGIFGVK